MTEAPAAAPVTGLADGQWHHLHPATPLLKGGIAFLAVLGIVISNLRERLVNIFLGGPSTDDGDPIDQIYRSGLTGWALLVFAVVLAICVGMFYLSWRMHTFRIGADTLEVRSGLVFRTHRKARLDRIQGINVQRSLFPRLLGAAKLEVSVAGQDANVPLAYLSSPLADGLRRDILRLASGARTPEGQAGANPAAQLPGSLLEARINELLAPELDPDLAPPESVVRIPPGRLIGSIVLSGFTVFLLVIVVALIVGAATGRYWLLFAILPGMIGSVGFYSRRFAKSLRYSIAGTADGVRVGFGLFSVSNETLPPGRIHAVEVLQPLLWRPFAWWQIRIDTAGHSRQKGAAGQANTTILPVGDAADVFKVLTLVLPGLSIDEHATLLQAGMVGTGGGAFTAPPTGAAVLRPFSWRRTGYALAQSAVLLRTGGIWRRLVVVPLARLQSVELRQGPLRRWLHLAAARLHTVEGPVRSVLPVIGVQDATAFFETVAAGAITAAGLDTSHRWAGSEGAP